jgi:hypothetical protein
MSLKVVNEGELELLDKCLKDALSVDEGYTLKLYKNDYTPTNTDTSASYTVANFDGYADQPLTRAGWNAATTNGSGEAESTYSIEQSWTCNSGTQTIYGYYVLGATSGKVLWAERFTTTRTLAAGDMLKMTPKFTLRSQN